MHKALLFAALLCAATSTLHAVPCPITHAPPPSEADEALAHGKFEDAQRLYAAMPASEAATAGIVRAELGQRKFDDALALIQKELQTHPQDGFLLDVLGEVRYRRGEVDEAAKAYQQAAGVAPCLARVH
jgi:cytochrome c-type biogenesis protein CcmH/NrfG